MINSASFDISEDNYITPLSEGLTPMFEVFSSEVISVLCEILFT